MIARSPRVAVLLTVLLTVGPPLTMAPVAQGAPDCPAAVAEQFERETRAFENEAQQKNISFLHNLAMANTTASLKTLTARGPSSWATPTPSSSSPSPVASDLQHAMEVRDKWQEVEDGYEKMGTYAEALEELWNCTRPNALCNLQKLLSEVNAEVKQWLESMGDPSMSALANHVAEARDMLQTYVNRTTNISTGTMTAMKNCTAPMVQRANASLSAAPANRATPATPAEDGVPEVAEPPSAPVNDGGGGTGKLLGGLALVGAAGYGAQALGLLGGKCAAEAPNNYHEVCEDQGRNTNTCRALQDEYRVWCDCRKGTFSYPGGCR